MKKFASFVLLLGVTGVVHGATLSWSAANIYQPGTTTALSSGVAYLFVTEQSKDFGSTVTTVDSVTDLIKSGAEFYTETTGTGSEQVTKNYIKKGDDKIQIAAIGATTSAGRLSGATGYYGNFGAGDSLKAFAVVFDADTLAGASNFLVTETKEASWTSATGAKTLGFGNQANATWTPVPEPSTAVLALAGLALLLKRRRA